MLDKIGFDQTDEDILTEEFPDEAPESAANTGMGKAVTLAFCSGLDTCPA
jgi:hypothetical protein